MLLFKKNIYLIIRGHMSQFNEGKLKNVSTFLEEIKIFTIDQIVSSLNCSIPTARLKLKYWQAYTSYNHNSDQNIQFQFFPMQTQFHQPLHL